MLKIQRQTEPTKRKSLKESTKGGAIDNKAFYEITERLISIMKKLEITNSYTIKDYGEVVAQTEVILTSLGVIEDAINGHIDNYIDKED